MSDWAANARNEGQLSSGRGVDAKGSKMLPMHAVFIAHRGRGNAYATFLRRHSEPHSIVVAKNLST